MNNDKIILGIILFSLYSYGQRKNNNPKIFYYKKLINNYNGFIIPPFGIAIKESEKNNTTLINHEKVHWLQYQREGLIPFILNYSIQNIINGYDKNIYEIEARYEECDECKLNYTNCVRTGKAKTVFNPNFRTL